MLAIGRLGLILEDEENQKWRLVYDATISGINPKIQIPERCELPGLQDLTGILASGLLGQQVKGLKIDVKAAFKCIKLLPSEYHKNVTILDGKYYFYKVLPFGSKISAYIWQRLAALIHRIIQQVLAAWTHAGLVYVDDTLWIFKQNQADKLATLTVAMLQILKVPLSWKKTKFSNDLSWVGFLVDLCTREVQIPPIKLQELKQFITDKITHRNTSVKIAEKITGKLSWAASAFIGSAPFLANLYRQIAAVKGENKFFFKISAEVSRDLRMWWWITSVMPFRVPPIQKGFDKNYWIRTDARTIPATIAGWYFPGENPLVHEIMWFQYQIQKDTILFY